MIGDHFGADVLGLCLHLFHQPRALDDIGKAGVVFHVGGNGHLTARLYAFNDDRLQHGAGSVNCSGITGWTGTEDQNFCVFCSHGRAPPWSDVCCKRSLYRDSTCHVPEA